MKKIFLGVVSFFVVLDFLIFFLSYFAVNKFGEIFPQYMSSDERYPRMVGAFFFLCAVARLHGVINSNEKGAFRVCLWSAIIEFFYHAFELWKGTMDQKKIIPVLVITGLITLWGTLLYRSFLNPPAPHQQQKQQEAKRK